MTPKEKANELIDKFSQGGFHQDFDHVKYCAEICVDEIIANFPEKRIDRTENYQWGLFPHPSYEYWQEVKKQISLEE